MRSSMRLMIFLLLAPADAAFWNGWNGWRDQHVRVSGQLGQSIASKMREARRLGQIGKEAPEHLAKAAKDMMKTAEYVNKAKRHNDAQMKKPEHERRKLMDVECTGRTCTVNGVVHSDMSLFDCPWVNSLHPYLGTGAVTADELLATTGPMTESPHSYLRTADNLFVDGGLCLPYQEIPFPYPASLYGGVDTTAAAIVCPEPGWNPDTGECSSGPGTCQYPGDATLHGGATGIAENYGCAAASSGWPSTPADSGERSTPICKTYVDDCTYSKPETRKYEYKSTETVGIEGDSASGYDYNWVLFSISKIRNGLGLGADMDADLNITGFAFPETMYEYFYGLTDGTAPPVKGSYPHAMVKGLFGSDGFVDTSKDGECSKMDSAMQWMDCGIPCPVGDEARMSKSDLEPFGGVVIAFMFGCALIGAVSFFVVAKKSEMFFVGGRSLNLFVVTATLASQSLDSNAALGNIDLGYKYHW